MKLTRSALSQATALARRDAYLCSRCTTHLASRRPFSSASPRRALKGSSEIPKGVMKMVPKQESMKTQMNKMGRGEVPTDFGLLPQTYIPPLRKDLPSWFSEPMLRTKMLYFGTKYRLQCLFQLWYFIRQTKRDPLTGKKLKKPPLLLSKRYNVVRALHKGLYQSIASGEMAVLQKIACNGLLQRVKIRLDHRKTARLPNETWELEKYKGITYPLWLRWPLLSILPNNSIQVVSDKVVPLPLAKDSSIRQVVASIRSVQSLDKGDGKGPRKADMEELLVIQKVVLGERERPWMVWGTTKRLTMPEVKTMMKEANLDDPGSNFVDQVKARIPFMT